MLFALRDIPLVKLAIEYAHRVQHEILLYRHNLAELRRGYEEDRHKYE